MQIIALNPILRSVMPTKPPTKLPLFPVKLLGQSGCRISMNGVTLYIDPYLSDSVRLLDSPDLVRLIPIPHQPNEITDADWVLITHSHIDHCDPHTLPELAKASPQCQFIGPPPVIQNLLDWGVKADRLALCKEEWSDVQQGVRIHAIPAAHPKIKRDNNGALVAVGYMLECAGKRIYFAGDTIVVQELIEILIEHNPIDIAFLPVNEDSFFRRRRGIIGNMSIRDAFLLAEEVKIGCVVPVHWDMFAANTAYPTEIKTIYENMPSTFELLMNPTYI